MKRVLLDTNIYGRVIERFHEDIIKEANEKKALDGHFVVYGNDIIRKELRATSKNIKIRDNKLRIALLNLYDVLTGNHILSVDSKIIETGKHYYRVYKELGGNADENEILNDFTIVACASINRLDLVYSDDDKTMASPKSIKSYRIVNSILGLRTPAFEKYSEFIEEIRRLLA